MPSKTPALGNHETAKRFCNLRRADDAERVIAHVVARIGHRYDLRNIVGLVRYLLPTPPVRLRWRRRTLVLVLVLVLGSGDPTRAICSTLIAQAFESVRYPILPIVEQRSTDDPLCPEHEAVA
jgi:hypothetical protein